MLRLPPSELVCDMHLCIIGTFVLSTCVCAQCMYCAFFSSLWVCALHACVFIMCMFMFVLYECVCAQQVLLSWLRVCSLLGLCVCVEYMVTWHYLVKLSGAVWNWPSQDIFVACTVYTRPLREELFEKAARIWTLSHSKPTTPLPPSYVDNGEVNLIHIEG